MYDYLTLDELVKFIHDETLSSDIHDNCFDELLRRGYFQTDACLAVIK